MGLEKNKMHEERGKKGKRGSVNNQARLDAFASRELVGSADWGECDPAKLQDVIAKITAMGGAVTIGLSRDKGAHGLTLLLDGARKPLWFNGDADLDAELDKINATLDAMD